MTARRRLGWLGPAIVLVGAAIAGVAIWYMQGQRPVPGEVIDTIAIDGQRTIVVRHEASSPRSFVELRDGAELRWRALVPPYAGGPGRRAVAWSDRAVTIRVARHGRAEVFAFARDNAHKLGAFKLAQEHEPIATHAQGPITLTDHARAYELVAGPGWAQLIAIDLHVGGGVWKVELGDGPILDGGVQSGAVWLLQGGRRRTFEATTGREITGAAPGSLPGPDSQHGDAAGSATQHDGAAGSATQHDGAAGSAAQHDGAAESAIQHDGAAGPGSAGSASAVGAN